MKLHVYKHSCSRMSISLHRVIPARDKNKLKQKMPKPNITLYFDLKCLDIWKCLTFRIKDGLLNSFRHSKNIYYRNFTRKFSPFGRGANADHNAEANHELKNLFWKRLKKYLSLPDTETILLLVNRNY